MTSCQRNPFLHLLDIFRMKPIITLFFILVYASVNGQLKQKTADKLYHNMEYAKCVEMYDELAKKCLKQGDKGNWENLRKAAMSHYHLFDMESASAYFQKLQNKNLLTETDRTYYIEALRYTEKYGRSVEVIRESSNLHPNNTFFKRLLNESDQFETLFKDSAFYRINESSINSDKGDFGVAYFNKSIVFASKAENTGFLNPTYGWDDAYFLNVMQAGFNVDSSLQKPQLLKHNFISRAHDGPVSFNADGTRMIITKNKLGKKNGKEVVVLAIYFSDLVNGEWSKLEPFEFNNESYNVGHAVFNQDESKLFFVSDKPGGFGESDIYVSEKYGQSWSEPKNLGPTVNTERKEMFPFIQGDALYFASNGHFGLGGLDIFQSNTSGTSTPLNIGYPINTSHDDFNLIFDSSERIGFLSSNRMDNIDRIYHVERRLLNISIEGDVYAQYEEKEVVPNQLVWVKNMSTNQVDTITTDATGHFSTKLDVNNEYRIYTSKEEFISLNEEERSTLNIRKDSTLYCELLLKPTTIQIHLRVVEKGTEKVIPLATTTITDYNIKWDTTLITNDQGIVTLTVDRNKVLWAHGAKKGYIDGDISFNTSNETDKVIDIELSLPPIKKGEKFKLENIFYDLNKSSLREESMSSLDKLADFLLKNNLKIELSAHTDSRGSNSYNQRLSQARAQSCVDYLIKKGVAKSNIKAKGYGEYQLVNKCKNGVKCSEEEHQENRRTEVKILEVN